MSTKRYAFLLDPRYQREKEVLDILEDLLEHAPQGDASAFLRAMTLIGFHTLSQSKTHNKSEA